LWRMHFELDRTDSTSSSYFFFHAPAPTKTHTLSLHDALPIWGPAGTGDHTGRRSGVGFQPPCFRSQCHECPHEQGGRHGHQRRVDRKSTRLNSSHVKISYAASGWKKKKEKRCHKYTSTSSL